MKKKKIWIDLLMLGLFIVGIGALLYPFVSDSLSDYLDQQIISYYQEQENQRNKEEIDKVQAEMENKNREIARHSSPGVDPYSILEEDTVAAQAPLSFYEEHTIGVVTIPKINVRLPIFDETLPALLEKGASLLDGTSYPTGGESTHSVLTSHSGLTQAKLFTDLEKLEEGDEFYVEVNGRTLAYRVEQIKVVLPTETDDVKVIEGKDLLTLITCTPYMINSHRLLVRGHRIPYLPTTAGPLENVAKKQQRNMILLGTIVTVISVSILIILIRIVTGYIIARREYNLSILAQNQTGEPLPNLAFELLNARGNKAIRDAEGKAITIHSNHQGEIRAENLKGGSYILRNQEENLLIQVKIKRVNQKMFQSKLKQSYPNWRIVKADNNVILCGNMN